MNFCGALCALFGVKTHPVPENSFVKKHCYKVILVQYNGTW